MQLERLTYLGAVLLLLSACGGGGSSGGSNDPPPPPPAPTQVSVSANNVEHIIIQVANVSDTLFKFSLSATERMIDFIGRGSAYTRMCGNARGDVNWTLEDNDGDGTLSAGDQATIEYVGCEEYHTGGLLTGTIKVSIHELDMSSGTLLRATVTTIGALSAAHLYGVTIDGQVEIFYYGNGFNDVFELTTGPGDEWIISYNILGRGDTIEKVTSIALRRAMRTNENLFVRYEHSFSLVLDSSALAGTLDCDTTSDLIGQFGVPPEQGSYSCFGANNTSLKLSATVTPTPIFTIEVDDNGDGTFEEYVLDSTSQNNWTAWGFSDLFKWRVIGSPGANIGAVQVPQMDGARIEMDIRDAIYDAASNRLYIGGINEIVILDATSLAQLDQVPLPYTPTDLAISDDGSRLWIAYDREPVIQSLTTADNSLGPEISLFSPPPIVDPSTPHAMAIAIAPGTNDLVVVILVGRYELVAFDNDMQLPQTVPFAGGSVTVPDFVDDQTIAIGLGRPPGRDDLSLIELDPLMGLSVIDTLPGFLENESQQIFSDDNFSYSGSGRIIDVQNRSVKGQVPWAYNLRLFDFKFDADKSHAYVLGSNYVVSTYLLNPVRLVSTYQFDIDGVLAHFVSDSHLFVASRTQIIQTPLANLAENYPDEACKLADLTDLIMPGTFLSLQCGISDAIYDMRRDTLIVGTKATNGKFGSAIHFVDPQLGVVQESVLLGTSPGQLSLSDDGLFLYVSLTNASEIAVIDLNTRSLLEPIRLGLEQDEFGTPTRPYYAASAAPSPVNSSDVVAGVEGGDLALYMNRVRAPDIDAASSTISNVFLSQDGSRALALSPVGSGLFDVAATGISLASTLATNLADNAATKRESEVFAVDGQIFDLTNEIVTIDCVVQSGGLQGNAVSPNFSGFTVYYVRYDSGGLRLDICDRATGILSPTPPIPHVGVGVPYIYSVLPMANGLLAIAKSNGIVIFDNPSP